MSAQPFPFRVPMMGQSARQVAERMSEAARLRYGRLEHLQESSYAGWNGEAAVEEPASHEAYEMPTYQSWQLGRIDRQALAQKLAEKSGAARVAPVAMQQRRTEAMQAHGELRAGVLSGRLTRL